MLEFRSGSAKVSWQICVSLSFWDGRWGVGCHEMRSALLLSCKSVITCRMQAAVHCSGFFDPLSGVDSLGIESM